MSLIKCPECSAAVSSFGELCPSCGFPLFLKAVGKCDTGQPGLARVDRIVLGSLCSKPVEWMPMRIDPDEGLMLLVSANVLARRPFSLRGETSWWDSDLCSWAQRFAFDLFSTEERRVVVENPFVLTARQAEELFDGDSARMAWPFGGAPSLHSVDGCSAIPWWLSTPSEDGCRIQYVRADGRVFALGADPTDELGVRLALWVEPEPVT